MESFSQAEKPPQGSLSPNFVAFDSFAQSFRFGLPAGKLKYQSRKGCCLSGVLAFVIFLYGLMQMLKLLHFGDTDVMVSQRDAYFSSDYQVSKRLKYAFGITAYDSNQEPIEDPTYGVLKPYYKSWGIKGTAGADFEPVPYHSCTPSELQLDGSGGVGETESRSGIAFFQPSSNSISDLTFYNKKLKCLDVDKITIQGDYNSPKARQFVILFEKCDNSTYVGPGVCKSEEQIKGWLARKFILINFNQMRFETREFSPKLKIVEESKLLWVPISTQLREELVYKVQLTDLYLQDSYFQFSELTEDEMSIFSQSYQLSRPYEFVDNVHLQISFEFDLTLYRVDRDVYSILDWVGDVGGLTEGFYIFLQLILITSQFSEFDHLLIERLFTKPADELGEEVVDGDGTKNRAQSRYLNVSKTRWYRQKFKATFPTWCCRCIQLSKEEQLFARARRQLSQELDIVQFLKKIRRFEFFMVELQAAQGLNHIQTKQAEIRDIEKEQAVSQLIENGKITPMLDAAQTEANELKQEPVAQYRHGVGNTSSDALGARQEKSPFKLDLAVEVLDREVAGLTSNRLKKMNTVVTDIQAVSAGNSQLYNVSHDYNEDVLNLHHRGGQSIGSRNTNSLQPSSRLGAETEKLAMQTKLRFKEYKQNDYDPGQIDSTDLANPREVADEKQFMRL